MAGKIYLADVSSEYWDTSDALDRAVAIRNQFQDTSTDWKDLAMEAAKSESQEVADMLSWLLN